VKFREARASKAIRRSLVIALAAGALAAWGASLLLSRAHPGPLDGGTLALAALLGAALVVVPILSAGGVLHWLTEHDVQRRALVNVRPLMGDLPLPLGRWAIDPRFAEILTVTIGNRRPQLVVELGSGASTVIAAASLRALGEGRVLSLEHDAGWAEQTRALLGQRGLDGWAEVVHAPLVDHGEGRGAYRWYALPDPARFEGGIDLLVVDGPPRKTSPDARYPALPLFREHLSPASAILMDDGNRREERSIVRRWARELRATVEHFPEGRGTWLLRELEATSPRTPSS
jgi:predicted O-methyltransferase YrrM